MCVKVTINNQVHKFEESLSILDAARSIGVDIPTLCHDERLKPIGSCRMCLVDVEGKPHPVTACNNSIVEGMVISTHPPALENERRMLLKMLAQDHPAAGLTEAPEKPFYRYARQYGLTDGDFNGSPQANQLDDSHPYIHVDMSQCIVCYRCVRICEEVQGQFVWQVLDRGHETRIVPDSRTTLRESSCVSCGATDLHGLTRIGRVIRVIREDPWRVSSSIPRISCFSSVSHLVRYADRQIQFYERTFSE